MLASSSCIERKSSHELKRSSYVFILERTWVVVKVSVRGSLRLLLDIAESILFVFVGGRSLKGLFWVH